MSTITKEWLQQKISDMEAARDEIPFGLDEDDSNTLAALRIALASLEAEPVCVIDQSNLDYLKSGSDADVWPASRTEMGDVLLYRAAPPAPVSVPAAMEMDDDFDSAFEHGKAVGWNAYRAAMLQSFGNSEQLNSPVIPDGWVACSEQMPEENAEQEVLACFKGGDISTLYYFEGRWDDAYGIVPIRQDVTHWMPLPAAPQQEA
ncbi:DUF551 domain-containing protein [Enterobacter cloacae]|uniref:DUF551 domain-containing protein n=1 Tax=Enterobacter cloacae TaxID=550 RepID=UPI000735DE5F|nr:DUF551 domain-containing protein [Enterobacter cloacae]KTH92371.1 hypothetical protein ASV16_00930 [Enterobacter cloacae subsp. cloacae]